MTCMDKIESVLRGGHIKSARAIADELDLDPMVVQKTLRLMRIKNRVSRIATGFLRDGRLGYGYFLPGETNDANSS